MASNAIRFNASGGFDLVTALQATTLGLGGALSGATTGAFSTSIASPILTAPAATDLNIDAIAAQDVIVKLGDAIGAKKILFKDSAAAEVGSIDSDGLASFSAFTTSGAVTAGSVALSGTSITNDGGTLKWGTAALATQAYVSAAIEGLDVKGSVLTSSAINVSLTDYLLTDAMDAVTIAEGDRVLLLAQTDSSEEGIYVVGADGTGTSGAGYAALTRAADMSTSAESIMAFTFIEEGTARGGRGYTNSVASNFVLDTTDCNFVLFSSAGAYSAGIGIALTGSSISLHLTNLDAAVVDVATDSIAFLDASDGGTLTKLESIADLATAMTGDGILASAGVFGVDVSDFAGDGLEDDGSENLRIKAGGVAASMLTGSFTAGANLLKGAPVYFKGADSKMWPSVDTALASAQIQGLAAAAINADAAGAFYTVDGSVLTGLDPTVIADDTVFTATGIDAVEGSLTVGAQVYALHTGRLVSAGMTLANWLTAGDFFTPVGVATAVDALILRIGQPQAYQAA